MIDLLLSCEFQPEPGRVCEDNVTVDLEDHVAFDDGNVTLDLSMALPDGWSLRGRRQTLCCPKHGATA